ncbi:peptidase M15D vanX D-ala-D-ala dipeptidase [Arcobacter nitrofigilis DSM 7299]|uniref:D-alanyl-D-alanine dipeptidase n=1 Tax=Arcobacter nitrofigilis (strain ATCC 33309 / DSM 7299 / CCUG 15893 / LMG 7604 / NCTC 12251 / CI) TaxID=572480 RepID=D5V336_ARCNC|nr:M15 family metallopeptidase [Arcobacter nitrofigilis]ADG92618.1 peptidase M15D vanX D-ala-D-ala dipeptidase [Arcobacter nitrofigilis DSM 7299]
MKECIINKPIINNEKISWDTVYSMQIVECEEELVPLSLSPEHILVRSAYFEAGLAGSLPECYARSSIRERLMKAANLLPKDLRLVVLDAWRSHQVQKTLFEQCQSALNSVYPDIDEKELHNMTQQYVALPSFNPRAPSPHSTGGAIDLMIATRAGVPLFFGSPFDHPTEISDTRYFEEKLENKEILSKEESIAMENRRLLYNIMTEVGFVNLPSEWWHYEFGTQRYAHQTGKEHAIYGAKTLCLNSFETFKKDKIK